MYCDPEAADITFTSGMNTVVTGIDLTTQVIFTGECILLEFGLETSFVLSGWRGSKTKLPANKFLGMQYIFGKHPS